MPQPPDGQLIGLVEDLCRNGRESETVEFKHNQSDPSEIGSYISALSNSAALEGAQTAYIIWGIEDESRALVGTSFDPHKSKIGNELLEGWLNRLVQPQLDFRFKSAAAGTFRVVVLEIPRAISEPTRFRGEAYIRVGSYRKKLSEQPDKARHLWKAFDKTPFEKHLAEQDVAEEEVIRRLDYPAYFELLSLPLPEGRKGILSSLADEHMIVPAASRGQWHITNLGALLFAKRLSDFGSLQRKAMRVIHYKGTSRVQTLREQIGTKGYANGFEGLIDFINGLIPSNEVIERALRRNVPMYPELAVRELVANALIHQNFAIIGAGPMVEIFDDRIEITNPGQPIVAPERFLDTPPRSRNEKLAGLMRRFGICEERGTGVDKVVFEIEFYQLPAPLFEVAGDNTRVVMHAHRPLNKMSAEDRIRACYQHACLKYVSREPMTNSTVRQRFGIEARNSAQASRLIKEALGAGVIYPYDPAAAPKQMRYVPGWAKDST